jgi:hypothetical protein
VFVVEDRLLGWDRRDKVELMCMHAEAVELQVCVPVKHGRKEVSGGMMT